MGQNRGYRSLVYRVTFFLGGHGFTVLKPAIVPTHLDFGQVDENVLRGADLQSAGTNTLAGAELAAGVHQFHSVDQLPAPVALKRWRRSF